MLISQIFLPLAEGQNFIFLTWFSPVVFSKPSATVMAAVNKNNKSFFLKNIYLSLNMI